MTHPVDALTPAAITEKVLALAQSKTALPWRQQLPLTALAGAYIGIAALFSTLALGDAALPFAAQKILGGACFSLGLLLVVVAGAELFTGNTMIAAGALEGRISWSCAVSNWVRVWLGNLLGALALAAVVFFSHAAETPGVAKGLYVVAGAKLTASWSAVFFKGILCNFLVCLGVWLSYAGRTVIDKAAGVFLPVTAFVALGFEHCVANMFFLPMAYSLKLSGVVPEGVDAAFLTLPAILANLSAATLGNIVAGAGLALLYKAAYHPSRSK